VSDLEVTISPKSAEDGSKKILKAFDSIDKAGTKTANSLTANLKKIETAFASLGGLRGPSATLAKQVAGLSAAMAGFRAPSSVSIANTKSLLAVLSSAGRVNPALLTALASASASFGSFRGPSAASVANMRSLLNALKTASTPRGLSGIVSGLNSIATAATHANASVSTLAASLKALKVGAVTITPPRIPSLGGGRGAGAASLAFKGLKSDSLSLSAALLRTEVAFKSLMAAFGLGKIIEVNVGFQQIQAGLLATTDSATDAHEQFGFLSRITAQLGLDLQTTAKGFTSFLGGIQGTSFTVQEAQTVYENMSKASRVLHLSTDDLNGVFRALTQIISKGSLQSEELRGQLGDRLPGAFSAMAKALGVTQLELQKMMKQGQVTGQTLRDGIIKFSEIYADKTAPGMNAAIVGLQASIARLGSAFDVLLAYFGESGFNEAIKSFTDNLTRFLMSDAIIKTVYNLGQGLKFLSDHTTEVIMVLKALATVVGGVLLNSFTRMIGVNAIFAGLVRGILSLRTAIPVIGLLVGALRGLWAIMLANPITALITIGTTLAAMYFSWKTAAVETKDAESDLSDQLERRKQLLGDLIDLDQKSIDIIIKQKEKEIKVNDQLIYQDQVRKNAVEQLNDSLLAQRFALSAKMVDAYDKLKKNANGTVDRTQNIEAIKALQAMGEQFKQLGIEIDANISKIKILDNEIKGLGGGNTKTLMDEVELLYQRDKNRRTGAASPNLNLGNQGDTNPPKTKGKTTMSLIKDVTDRIRELNQAQKELDASRKGQEALFKQQDIDNAQDLVDKLTEGAQKGDEFNRMMKGATEALSAAGYKGKTLQEQLEKVFAAKRKISDEGEFDNLKKELDQKVLDATNMAKAMGQGPEQVRSLTIELEAQAATRSKFKDILSDEAQAWLDLQRIQLNQIDVQQRLGQFQKDLYDSRQGIADLNQEIALRRSGIGDLEKEVQLLQYRQDLQNSGMPDDQVKILEAQRRKTLDLQKVNQDLIDSYERMKQVISDVGDAVVDAFSSVIFESKNVKDAITDLIKQVAQLLFRYAIAGLMKSAGTAITNFFGSLGGAPNPAGQFAGGGRVGFAKGGIFDQGSPSMVRRFGLGDVVKTPTNFAMGQMGEAGPEAIMPLRRTPSGHLGVAASTDGGMTNNFNVTVNVEGSGNTETDQQQAQRIGKVVNQNMKDLVLDTMRRQMKNGGMLNPGISGGGRG
jgi:tape measure domain-containing protein